MSAIVSRLAPQRAKAELAEELAGLNDSYDHFATDGVAEQDGYLAALHKIDIVLDCVGGPKEGAFGDMMECAKRALRRQTIKY
ncbi:MAG: hypothetical protein ABI197_05500 [Granulicella sp.]